MTEEDKNEVIDETVPEDKPVVDRGDDFNPDPDPIETAPISKDALEDVANDEPIVPEIKIPKSRFDEVNERMKAAEARLAEREAADAEKAKQAEAASATSIKDELAAKTKEYHKALIDGDFDSIDQLALDLEAIREKAVEARAQEIAMKKVDEARANDQRLSYAEKVNARAIEIAEANKFLIDGSDPEARELFEMVRDGAMARGNDNIKAMDKALEAVLKLRGEAVSVITPKPPSTLQKKIDAAKLQPPRPVGIGNRAAGSTTPGRVSEMSEAEFSKIPEAERKRLRGDIV
jgi:hypothetical protein